MQDTTQSCSGACGPGPLSKLKEEAEGPWQLRVPCGDRAVMPWSGRAEAAPGVPRPRTPPRWGMKTSAMAPEIDPPPWALDSPGLTQVALAISRMAGSMPGTR